MFVGDGGLSGAFVVVSIPSMCAEYLVVVQYGPLKWVCRDRARP